jgi:hypothetical protein
MRAIRTIFGELKAAFMKGVREERREQAERFFVGEMDGDTEMVLMLEEYIEAMDCNDPVSTDLLLAYTDRRTKYIFDQSVRFKRDYRYTLTKLDIDTRILGLIAHGGRDDA